MRADAGLFYAYEYGTAIGLPASEVLKLPVDEIQGFLAYRKIRNELSEDIE
mgnify:CR=1 FL=1